MSSLFAFIKRLRTALNPPTVPTTDNNPIRFGILGAAAIAPIALIDPARCHAEAIIYAVAARDKGKAESYAKKHGIPTVFAGYQELIDCPEIDAVYNPLPNGLHYEWTMKALEAGKHVLLEKPSTDTTEETRKIFDLAEQKGLVVLEAFHYRFHPAVQRVKAILESGELGPIKKISNGLAMPSGMFKSDDIRFNYDLGGGALMDMGCYTINAMRYFTGAEPVSVASASHALAPDSRVDRGTTATLTLPGNVTGNIHCDLNMPWRFGILPPFPKVNVSVECERGSIDLMNFVAPVLYHSITVVSNGKKRVEKAYSFSEAKMEGKGEVWWTTYRYQLEAFIDRLKGRTPQAWISREDSCANMEAIEKIYEKSGLGSRPKSTHVPT